LFADKALQIGRKAKWALSLCGPRPFAAAIEGIELKGGASWLRGVRGRLLAMMADYSFEPGTTVTW
jgi:hypothetical protein